MDARTSSLARKRRVNQLLRQLSLYGSRFTLIGDPGLLFCDEPTTGLDSSSAHQMMTLLRASAVQGKTVICTIHQPNTELMAQFDKLVLLAEGRVAFAGTATQALGFFKSLGYQCPLMYNPTDYFIKVLSLTPGSESASRQAIKSVCDRFAVSDEAKELDMEIQYEFHMMDNEDSTRSLAVEPHDTFVAPFFLTKLWWLIYRYLLIVIRDPRVQFVRILQKLAIALTAGLCFMGTARLTQSGIQDVQGALFIIIAENTFSPMYSVLHMFPEEFPLLNRELKAGLLKIKTCSSGKTGTGKSGTPVKDQQQEKEEKKKVPMSKIQAVKKNLKVVKASTRSFFSCAFGSMPVAIAYLVPFDYALMMTSGLFIKLSSMPKYVSWIRHLSWLMYSNEAMSIVQWDGVQNITCITNEAGMPCLSTGEEVLTTYDFQSSNLWMDVLALFILYLAFHSLAVLALRHRTRRK
ncbi:hypothetical protein HF086_013339 [Spodoptera exigua]|uniref:Uncharacterized protein n=1 Tax=Spodoptera exigua TaxID=7107 RepID=A0A922M3H0_SPOEX|nr:hypothetical protein HF086_013339 [Spodoptera exigua]